MDTVLLKYHHSGNDYLVYDICKNSIELDERAIRTICARNFGIGSQGILAGPVGSGDKVGMKIYRPDGSEARVSRNAARIFMRYLKDAGYVKQQELVLHTEEGDIPAEEAGEADGGDVEAVGKLFLSEGFVNRNHMKVCRQSVGLG